jgi:LPXTG-motif cell wall-anchored protein
MPSNTFEPESHESLDTGKWKQHLGNWGAYAAAAGAALAMSTNASAASIISSAPGLTVSITPGPQRTTFSVAGALEALMINRRTAAQSRTAGVQIIDERGGLKFGASGISAKRYVTGQPIMAVGHSYGFVDILYKDTTNATTRTIGRFGAGASNGFLGFQNAAGDLGWLHVQVTIDGSGFPSQLELIAWAYNDVAGAPIEAGQTTEAAATPEPGAAALGLLALGAAGILALRKRRNQLAK